MKRWRQRRFQLERVRFGAGLERSRRNPLGTNERIGRRERRVRYRAGLTVIAAGLAATVGWRLLTPIHTIDIQAPDETVARQAVAAALSSTSDLNLFIDTDKLAEQIVEAIPSAVKAEIRHSLILSKISIQVDTQKPSLRWQSRGVGYVISDYGIALTQVSEADANLPLVFDEAGVEVQLKQQVVPRTFSDFVIELDSLAAKNGLVIRERHVTGSTRELRLIIKDKAYSVLVDTTRSAEDQINELKSLEAYFISIGHHARDYADLRVPGRAYWQ